MILADTSDWIDYFRDDLPELGERLRRHEVFMHPFIEGELACGNFSNREATLELLQQLRSVTVAEHGEVMTFIRAQKLYGLARSRRWIIDQLDLGKPLRAGTDAKRVNVDFAAWM